MERIRLRIKGKVQGVFYRRSAELQANKLALSGWVRNLPDGSVEAFAVGPRAKLEEFVGWCYQGPPGARVETVEVSWRSPEQSEDDEQVLPDSGFTVIGSW